jgi:hypothetical protein
MKNIVLVCQTVDVQSNNRRYDHTHINCMRTMLNRANAHYDRLVVITNVDPALIHPDFEVFPLSYDSRWKGWWSKMSIYNPQLQLKGSVMYLDLDVIPCAQINQLWQYATPGVSMRRALHLEAVQNISELQHRYNSSVQTFPAGLLDQLYHNYVNSEFNQLNKMPLDGDERYVSEFLVNSSIPHSELPIQLLPYYPRLVSNNQLLKTATSQHIPTKSHIPYADIAVLVFAGSFKPWSVAQLDSTIAELYPI